MKTGLKVTAIILGSIIAAGGILYCTLGGLPAKKRAERDCPNLSWTMTDYELADVRTPDDYQTVSMYGVSLKVPKDMKPAGTEGVKQRVYVSTDKLWSVMFMEPYEFGELDLMALGDTAEQEAEPETEQDTEKSKIKHLSAKLLDDYVKDTGKPMDDWYSFFYHIYTLNPDDCNIHSYRKAEVFYLFAAAKEELLPSMCQDIWNWHTEQGDGYICIMRKPDEKQNSWRAHLELFPFDDRNTSYEAMITTPDLDSLAGIINSARLTDIKNS